MLLYGAAIAAIGFMCATVLRWPAMLCIAGFLTFVAFVFYWATGAVVLQAILYSLYSLVLLQIFYVIGGFVMSLRLRRQSTKKNIEA